MKAMVYKPGFVRSGERYIALRNIAQIIRRRFLFWEVIQIDVFQGRGHLIMGRAAGEQAIRDFTYLGGER